MSASITRYGTGRHQSVTLHPNPSGVATIMNEGGKVSQLAYGMGQRDGGARLIGWRSMTITPDMVGRKVAVFAAIEPIGDVRMAPATAQFLRRVVEAGGLAGTAISLEEVRRVLGLARD